MKKFFSKIHLWLSLPVGIIFLLLCLTGSLLVFQDELKELTNPSFYKVEKVGEKPLPIGKLMSMAQRQLPDTLVLSSVTIPSEPDRNYSFGIEGQRRASVMVDPYSGNIRGQVMPGEQDFFGFVLRLHRWLLFPNQRGEFSLGKFLIGVGTLVSLFILLTGIIIWVPSSIRTLRARLKVQTGKGAFKFWYDLHLAGGIYAAIFLLGFTITGLTWSFDWYRNGFYRVFGVEMKQGEHGPGEQQNARPQFGGQQGGDTNGGGEMASADGEKRRGERGEGRIDDGGDKQSAEQGDWQQRKRERGEAGSGDSGEHGHRQWADASRPDSARVEGRGGFHGGGERSRDFGGNGEGFGGGRRLGQYRIWQTVYENLKATNPGFGQISLQAGSASVAPEGGNARNADRYSYDNETGEVTLVSSASKDVTPEGTIRGWIYKIHVGKWGGNLTRILSLLACLIGIALPLTGYYMYFKKLGLKKNRKKLEI